MYSTVINKSSPYAPNVVNDQFKGAQTKGPKTKMLPDKRAKKHRENCDRQKGQKSRQKGQYIWNWIYLNYGG